MKLNLHPKSLYTWTEFLENGYFETVLQEIELLLKDSIEEYFFEFFLFKLGFSEKIICSNSSAKKKVLFLLCDEVNHVGVNDVIGYNQVFKTYLPFETKGFIPIPVGFNARTPLLPIKCSDERSIDIFFSGNLNDNRLTGIYKAFHFLKFLPSKFFLYIYHRPRVRKLLRIKFPLDLSGNFVNSAIFFTQNFNSGLKPEEYAKYLSESKVVLCPKGFITTETFRMYEGLRQGCVVITEQLPDHEFYRNSPTLVVEDWRSLFTVLKKIDIEQTRKKCMAFYAKNLSELATARYIVKHLL